MFTRTLVAVAVVAMTLPFNSTSATAAAWTCNTAGTSLADCSFESHQFSQPYNWNSYQFAPTDTGWGYFDQFGHAGVAGPNSAYTWDNPPAPDGNNVGFVQDWGAIYQTVSNFGNGSYTLSFHAANRGGYLPSVLEVRLDGASLGDALLTQSAWAPYNVTFTTTAGSHQIEFAGVQVGNGADVSSLIDQVSLASTPPASGCAESAGTTLSQCTFDTPVMGPNEYTYADFLGSAWSFYSAGLTANVSNFFYPNAPDGLSQIAFIHNQGSIAQTGDNFAGGTYTLSFKASSRAGYLPQAIAVQLDGSQVLGSWPLTSGSYTTYAATFDAAAGRHTITFIGLNGANGGDVTGFITEVGLTAKSQPKQPVINYTGASQFTAGQPATLTAQLLDPSSQPVAGRTLSFNLDGQTCSVATDAGGNALCTIPAVDHAAGLAVPLTIGFAGDKAYLQATASTTVTIFHTTQLTYAGATSANFNDPFVASAVLIDNSYASPQNPVPNMPVTFTLGGAWCQAATDWNGVASCQLTPVNTANQYWLTASVPTIDAWQGSQTSALFQITHEETSLASTTAATALSGNVQVSAVLTEDGTRGIGGAWVNFDLGGAKCTAVSSATGFASCTVAAGGLPLGPTPLTVYFGGDSRYAVSTASGQVLLYAFPSQGDFVIGDRADPNNINFFDSKWSISTPTSGGTPPADFKGFAESYSGGTFTASNGNSSKAPQSVPSYMAVLVTGRVTESNGSITGNVERIGIVHVSLYVATVGGSGHGSLAS